MDRLMNTYYGRGLIIILFLITFRDVLGQEWSFVKEEEGISIYHRIEPGTSLKAYKGVTVLSEKLEDVSDLLVDFEAYNQWVDDISGMKTLKKTGDTLFVYFLEYDLPWPVTNRDLIAEASIRDNEDHTVRTIYSRCLYDFLPENDGVVRIKNFWQRWTLIRKGGNQTELILEGFTDPAGSIPDWIYNMVILRTPYDVISGVREELSQH